MNTLRRWWLRRQARGHASYDVGGGLFCYRDGERWPCQTIRRVLGLPPWVDTTTDDPMLPDPDDEPPPPDEDEPSSLPLGVQAGTKWVVNGQTLHTVECQYVQPWFVDETWPSTRAAIPPGVERKTLTTWMDSMNIHACSKCNPLDEEVTP